MVFLPEGWLYIELIRPEGKQVRRLSPAQVDGLPFDIVEVFTNGNSDALKYLVDDVNHFEPNGDVREIKLVYGPMDTCGAFKQDALRKRFKLGKQKSKYVPA